MRKNIIVKLNNGEENKYTTEMVEFDRKSEKIGYTDIKTESIGFVQIGKKRKTWIPLGINVAEINVYNEDTNELLEIIKVK